MFLPEADRLSYSKQFLESQLCSLFGGRIAEELVFGKEAITTGASNDIQRATDIARKMVTRWGMSERLGPLTYSEEEGEIFLGHSVTKHKDISDETAHIIDEEIRKIIDNNYAKAEQILKDSRSKLDLMAEALLKYETVDSSQIDAIMTGKSPPPPAGWDEEDRGGISGHTGNTEPKPGHHGTDQKPPVSGPKPA